MDQWTPRVTARAELASLLKSQYPSAAQAAGIKISDLDELITQGNIARQADIEQKEQLALLAVQRTDRKDQAADVFDRQDELRDRLPAVVRHLELTGQRQLAGFLSTLSFSRFRFRELAPGKKQPVPAQGSASNQSEEEEVQRVARVAREDIPTRASALAAFCRAVCKQGREPIVGELAERGLPVTWLEKLADDADALATTGRNMRQAATATAREAEASTAQRRKWADVRRMIRRAVKGVPTLESKFSEC